MRKNPLFLMFWKIVLLTLILAAPFAASAAITKDLQYGSRGAEVTELQTVLIAKGYLTGTATGNFYALTKSAVVAFQKALGLPQTGYVGPLTRAKLNSGQVTAAPVPTLLAPTTLSSTIAQIPFFVTQDTWEFSTSTAVQAPVTARPPVNHFIASSAISERTVDPRVVVYVACKFTGTLKGSSSGTVAPVFFVGSGVVVSPDGYILTAGHLVRPHEMNREDLTVVWKRDGCKVAQTDQQLTPIDYRDYENPTGVFRAVEIAYEPTDAEYSPFNYKDNYNKVIYPGGGNALDFALLKIAGTNLPYAPVVSEHLILTPGAEMLGLGYPGLDVVGAQSLERVDGQFSGFVWMEKSPCVTALVEGCGVQYQAKRYKANYTNLYGKQTSLGKYTSYFRGGFSGGPLFYKGNVVGIMIFGKENPYSNLHDLGSVGQWNWVEALASREIVSTLQKKGIKISTVP